MRKTCLDWVYKLARLDERVVFIGSDLSPGLLDEMRAELPSRWYMEGITEQNVVGMAAGMARTLLLRESAVAKFLPCRAAAGPAHYLM